ncbi:hypothetical protein B0T16DRAFT_129432 [Cercophora newfieldiana]|uniref:Uncharacterized protein n=1 Tax=Cercophora newfieldiana TaxID=92897 RepID=A0AA40CS98_9PEZI|nr:hypothetical protein B0T16DRAFT_129432 [Cercophora newfieldiana]
MRKSALYPSQHRIRGTECAIFSFKIRPLGELISMYQDREATDPRDKLFALMAMSADTPEELLPDYSMTSRELLIRLTSYIFGKHLMPPIACDARGLMAFRGRIRALGLLDFRQDRTNEWNLNNKNLWTTTAWCRRFSPGHGSWPANFVTGVPLNLFQKGDILCNLQGASRPVVVRLHNDFFSIVAIDVQVGDTGFGWSWNMKPGSDRKL